MNIICVDASPIALAKIRGQLLKMMPGAQIICCRSSEKALANALKNGCDILITDIDYGAMKGEGFLLAEKIIKTYPRVNIIFTTAASEREYALPILRIRYSGLLNKPYTVEELRKELEDLRYSSGENSRRSLGFQCKL